MATAKQIAANRRNAQKSCGPKSAETKAIVSQNSTKHGLCAKFSVLDEVEKQENFDIFLNQLMEDEQPVGQAEIQLVVKMAQHTWLSNRAVRMQNNCFALEPKTPEQTKNNEVAVGIDSKQLEVHLRYHAAHDRAYQRASTELQKRKKARELAEIGFASQKRQVEKHALQMEIAKLRKQRDTMRKQREEMKLGDEIAKMLPPDFTLADLNAAFSAAPQATPPGIDGN